MTTILGLSDLPAQNPVNGPTPRAAAILTWMGKPAVLSHNPNSKRGFLSRTQQPRKWAQTDGEEPGKQSCHRLPWPWVRDYYTDPVTFAESVVEDILLQGGFNGLYPRPNDLVECQRQR